MDLKTLKQKAPRLLGNLAPGVFRFCVLFFFILFLACLPLVIRQYRGAVVLRPLYFLMGIDFIKGIFTGNSFILYVEAFTWHAWRELPAYFIVSLNYVSLSALGGILIGLPLGILRYDKRFAASQKFLNFLNAIPDFFLICLLQLLVVTITQLTGVRIARISGIQNTLIWLPVLAMSFYPALYLIRIMSTAAYNMACQDYILCAKARGFSRRHIFFKEIMPGLIQVLEGDLTKVTLMVLSNLFIAERLFMLSGITTFLFHYGFQRPNLFGGGYQFNIVVNCLICLFLLFFIVRTGLKLLLLLIRKGSSR